MMKIMILAANNTYLINFETNFRFHPRNNYKVIKKRVIFAMANEKLPSVMTAVDL